MTKIVQWVKKGGSSRREMVVEIDKSQEAPELLHCSGLGELGDGSNSRRKGPYVGSIKEMSEEL